MSIHRRTGLVSLVVLLAGLLAGCGKATVEATNGVDLSDAWARTTPPGVRSGAAYLTISARQTDHLNSVGVDPAIAGTVELHQTVTADGSAVQGSASGGGSSMNMPGMDMSDGGSTGDKSGAATGPASSGAMTMRAVSGGIEVPSGKDFVLSPGGYHLMLMDLAQPLTAGQKFTLTLHFQRAGDQTVEVEVRDDAP